MYCTIITALRILCCGSKLKFCPDPNCLENPNPDPGFDDEMGKKLPEKNKKSEIVIRPFLIFDGCLDSIPECCRTIASWRATDL